MQTTPETDPNQVARTILKQLGGLPLLLLLIRPTIVTTTPSSVVMRYAEPGKMGNMIVITLAGDDTYTLTLYQARGVKLKELAKLEGIYCDQLAPTFESQTGLYLSFRPRAS